MPSVSKKQHNLMAMVANDPKAAKRLGIPQSVGEEFMKADKKRGFGEGRAMSKKPVKKMRTGGYNPALPTPSAYRSPRADYIPGRSPSSIPAYASSYLKDPQNVTRLNRQWADETQYLRNQGLSEKQINEHMKRVAETRARRVDVREAAAAREQAARVAARNQALKMAARVGARAIPGVGLGMLALDAYDMYNMYQNRRRPRVTVEEIPDVPPEAQQSAPQQPAPARGGGGGGMPVRPPMMPMPMPMPTPRGNVTVEEIPDVAPAPPPATQPAPKSAPARGGGGGGGGSMTPFGGTSFGPTTYFYEPTPKGKVTVEEIPDTQGKASGGKIKSHKSAKFGGSRMKMKPKGMADKMGRALKKKGAAGKAMMKYAEGGSVFRKGADGVAHKGKTKAKMVKMRMGGKC
jgi:hypothetical protein